MPIDRSKFIFHRDQWLPIDYILVYTRYHSNHFRRRHRFKRQHDEYRQFFQDRLRKLGFIVVEERLTDEVRFVLIEKKTTTTKREMFEFRKMIFWISVKLKHQLMFTMERTMEKKVIMHLFEVFQLYNDTFQYEFKISVHIYEKIRQKQIITSSKRHWIDAIMTILYDWMNLMALSRRRNDDNKWLTNPTRVTIDKVSFLFFRRVFNRSTNSQQMIKTTKRNKTNVILLKFTHLSTFFLFS